MKILQFISHRELNDAMTSQYMTLLVETLSDHAETMLATSVSQFKKMARQHQPDIIHIHGCWNFQAARAEQWAEQKRFPVVLSLHGQMQPWHFHHHYFYSKLPKYLLFQRKAIQEAEALHVHGKMEFNRMKSIGANTRLGMVPDCIISNSLTAQQMAEKMMALYQKVIDSNTFRLMNKQELEAESTLLTLGLALQAEAPVRLQDYAPLSQLDIESWRKIFIHSIDEHTLPVIVRAAESIGVDVNTIDVDHVERFPQKLKKPDGDLPRERLIIKNTFLKTALDNAKIDEKPDANELALSIMFANMKHHLSKGIVTRRHLANLYSQLRYTEYDEDKLQRMLHALKIEKFAARILHILGETFHLEEGYMPIEPIDDKTTKRIKQQLTKTNVQ